MAALERQQRIAVRAVFGNSKRLRICSKILKQYGWDPLLPHLLPEIPATLREELLEKEEASMERRKAVRRRAEDLKTRQLKALRTLFGKITIPRYTHITRDTQRTSADIRESKRIECRRYKERLGRFKQFLKEHGWDPKVPELIPAISEEALTEFRPCYLDAFNSS